MHFQGFQDTSFTQDISCVNNPRSFHSSLRLRYVHNGWAIPESETMMRIEVENPDEVLLPLGFIDPSLRILWTKEVASQVLTNDVQEIII